MKKVLFSLLCLLAAGVVASAQQHFTGTVTDISGEPVIGAGVVIEGSNTGVVTDLDGAFSIDAPRGARLVISSLGYLSQTVTADRSPLAVILQTDNTMLEDVVVIGYGTVKRRDLTGAVSSVRGQDLAANPVANVSQALQGKLSGVNVVSEDGRPGASVSVRVRGGGSITQSNEPLYIVDGFPVGNINDIPASEIESIDVLKDASATAIYGARGANGVILVTTKAAQSGRIKVSYDGYVQVKNAAKVFDTMSAQEYLLYNWGYATSRGAANGDGFARYFGLGTAYGNHYNDYANVQTHDYTRDLLRTAFSQSHTVNVSGGSDNTKVSFTLGYVGDQGIKINSDYNRFNAALKVSQKLAKRLTLDLDARFTETNTNGREGQTSGRGSILTSAYMYRPIDNPLGGVNYSDVTSAFSFGIENIDPDHNPVELVNDITNRNKSNSFRASAALSWEIIDGLTARSEVSLTRSAGKSTYYENGYTNKEKRATLSRSQGEGFRSLTTLNYNFKVGQDHDFGVMLGNEILSTGSETSTLNGSNYPESYDYETTMGLIQMVTANGKFSAINTIGVPAHTLSFFGRANYNYREKYFLTATFRADGSSKFAPNNRWGYFPAAAAAWRIIDEPWMDGAKGWLSNLKLRLSYGTSGSDNISSGLWHETWSTMALSNNKIPIGGEFIAFYAPDGLLANPDLKWETTISRNLGIDYGFWDGRINGAVELYWNTTKDLLMAVPVDNTTGYSYQYQNFGRTSNKGVELSVNAVLVENQDWRVAVGALYNYNHNNLDEMANADQYQYSSYWNSSASMPKEDFFLQVGRPIGLVRGFVSDGWYTVSDFDYANGVYTLKAGVPDIAKQVTSTQNHQFNVPSGQGAFPGAAKFKDVDKNGVVNIDDVTELGEMMPRHTGSFNVNVRYRNWDFATNFNWVLGGKIYNVNTMVNQSGGEFNGIGRQRMAFMADAYKVYNIDGSGNLYAVTDPSELNALNVNAQYPTPFHQNGITESRWLENGSYLRLQTLTVGYTLPNKVSRRIGIERMRFYLTAGNLFCLTGYTGMDPEVNTYTSGRIGMFTSAVNSLPTMNMDYGAYPRARSFTFGANITF